MPLVLEAPPCARTPNVPLIEPIHLPRMEFIIHCDEDEIRNILKGTNLEPQEVTIFRQLKAQFGWTPTRKIALHGVTLALHLLQDASDDIERKSTLRMKHLKIATWYEWICFTAFQPSAAEEALELSDVCIMGMDLSTKHPKETLIILHKDQQGDVFLINAKTLHSFDAKPRTVAGVCLTAHRKIDVLPDAQLELLQGIIPDVKD